MSDEREIYLCKNFCSDTALFRGYIIQRALYGIFSFMFNLCQMSYQEESLTGLMGLQLKKKKRQSVKEKIVPKWQHFEILMPWRSKRKIHIPHITFLMWTCVCVCVWARKRGRHLIRSQQMEGWQKETRTDKNIEGDLTLLPLRLVALKGRREGCIDFTLTKAFENTGGYSVCGLI